jgi:hypothetical protein
MYQSTTNDIIRFRCGAVHTTTPLDVSCFSKVLDKATGRLEELVPVCTVSNGTTNVTVSTAPASGKNKGIEGLIAINLDTVTHTVIIEWYNGTVARRQHSAELAAGESLVYARGDWSVYNPTGKEILVGNTGTAGTDGDDGALTVTEVEVDFGVVPVFEKQITVTDAGVSGTSKIIAVQSGKAATGRDADENEMDSLLLNCTPATGQFVLNCRAIPGPVSGLYKINYQFS